MHLLIWSARNTLCYKVYLSGLQLIRYLQNAVKIDPNLIGISSLIKVQNTNCTVGVSLTFHNKTIRPSTLCTLATINGLINHGNQ